MKLKRKELADAGMPSLVIEPPCPGTLTNIIREVAPEKVAAPKVQNQKRLEVISKTLSKIRN